MGTGRSGRYLNTAGSARGVSDFTLVHSNEGRYTTRQTPNGSIRLISGGHGQKNIEQLQKYGIGYNILRTYSNGVRVGNIPTHKNGRKRTGANHAWFPEKWTQKDIRRAGEHVASLKRNRHAPDGKPVYGQYKGVRVGIIRTAGKIATVFPDTKQNFKKKRRRK